MRPLLALITSGCIAANVTVAPGMSVRGDGKVAAALGARAGVGPCLSDDCGTAVVLGLAVDAVGGQTSFIGGGSHIGVLLGRSVMISATGLIGWDGDQTTSSLIGSITYSRPVRSTMWSSQEIPRDKDPMWHPSSRTTNLSLGGELGVGFSTKERDGEEEIDLVIRPSAVLRWTLRIE
jgi:hypothetical protein